ncbi:MAG: VanZ family protein [Armatimonadetes bacterium]|nr:VanZ family protein [Armatimonadota bacterium]
MSTRSAAALYWWVASGLWYAFILFETWSPRPAVVPPELSDWQLHAGGFAVLGLLMALAACYSWKGAASATLLLGAILGAISEGGQAWVPGRTVSFSDMAANIGGFAVAVGIVSTALLRTRPSTKLAQSGGGDHDGQRQGRRTPGL